MFIQVNEFIIFVSVCCCCCVASVVSDPVRPHRQQPTRLFRPWDSLSKNTGVGCNFLLQYIKVKVKVKSLSCVQLFATPWTAAYQVPPSMGFSSQEYSSLAEIISTKLDSKHTSFPSFHVLGSSHQCILMLLTSR